MKLTQNSGIGSVTNETAILVAQVIKKSMQLK